MIGKRLTDVTSPLCVLAKFSAKRCFASKMFKEKYAKVRPLKTPTMIAMDNFDFYYGPLYGNQWPSIRLGMLTPNKYFAVLNKFSRSVTCNFSEFFRYLLIRFNSVGLNILVELRNNYGI